MGGAGAVEDEESIQLVCYGAVEGEVIVKPVEMRIGVAGHTHSQPVHRVLSAALLVLLPACFGSPGIPLPTIDGPEDPSLISRARGTFVWVDPLGNDRRLQILDLPSGRRSELELRSKPIQVAGPDRDGRVVYVERVLKPEARFMLSVVSLRGGSESPVHEQASEILMGDDVRVSLAPTGGRVALVVQLHLGAYQFAEPALFVIDVASKQSRPIEGLFAMHRPCWFPDGRRVAVVEKDENDGSFVTSILDVVSDERVRVGSGVVRAISGDGASLFLSDEGRVLRVETSNGAVLVDPVSIPGLYEPGRVRDPLVADAGDGVMLYESLPTTGVEQELVRGFMAEGSAMWPLKLCDTDSHAFATVVPHLHYFSPISYGRIDARR